MATKSTTAKKDPAKNSAIDAIDLGYSKKAFIDSFNLHLHHTLARDRYEAADYEKFQAIAYAVRDRLIDRWIKTQQTYYNHNVKRVYYLSLEFLMGRSLGNAILNIDVEKEVAEALDELGLNLEELRDVERDAGLGNGGLGRLASCFLDSMATLELPAMGMGLRYEFGMFNQKIEAGQQAEYPDEWLRFPNPWEFARTAGVMQVNFGGRVESYIENGETRYHWHPSENVEAMPYDTPVPGYKNNTVNTLRLWSAQSNSFNLQTFNEGKYVDAVGKMEELESITKVLYPNDSSVNGKKLRLKQQYFLCSASLQDIIRRYERGDDVRSAIEKFAKMNKISSSELNLLSLGQEVRRELLLNFPSKVAIQLNDTHPAVAIPELMRLLMDVYGLSWADAWAITTQVFAYTNHTLMPEALEKWSVCLFEELLPRHLQIIYEINAKFLGTVWTKWPGENDRVARMSIIQEGSEKMVRMGYLSVIGSHSINGVAALHSELIKSHLFKDFYELWPERFNNKTNGVTPRRWIAKSNPVMTSIVTKKIGDSWIGNLDDISKLEAYANDAAFMEDFVKAKVENKKRLISIIKNTQGIDIINPDSIFDVQVKRIHEYKRQLLNIMHAIYLLKRIQKGQVVQPRTILIGGKSAPGYWMAKQIIWLVNAVSDKIKEEPRAKGVLQLLFLENYRVSYAEKIIPAADLSEQISTAGTEASGTGNMKFALNGALTIGTLDGANVEMCEAVGHENIYIFGKTVEEVHRIVAHGYHPREYYESSSDIREVLDFIRTLNYPECPFAPIVESLLSRDQYLLLADFSSYIEAQDLVAREYADKKLWTRKCILNVARMGGFSSDRTIRQYNGEIWRVPSVKIN
ncbi:MAG: glycogen/starch/alpha-glucan phosphorylase [Fibromonadaceae bacterium]|jgi:starch phosphorylase|nr:glycogen/starch/alpha-glucan phosphorylase [Fibromonadaceae bacterium]